MKKFVFLSVALLSACSHYASNGEALYLRSHNGAKLVVPPPLTQENLSTMYILPPQTQDARVNIAPPIE